MFSIKRSFLLLLCVLFGVSGDLQAQKKPTVDYYMDISHAVKPQVDIKVSVPKGMITTNEVIFCMPRTVPGTYQYLPYAKHVHNVKALNSDGKSLATKRVNETQWQIQDAKDLQTVSYEIIDTWHDADSMQVTIESAGNNFEYDKNFIVNTGATFGYFMGYESMPIKLTVDRPSDFAPTTSLHTNTLDIDTDVFTTSDYRTFVDCPIMFCRPDTASIYLGFTKIMVSVYSPNKILTAKKIVKEIKPLVTAQWEYLHEFLPVESYNFIMYFVDKKPRSGAATALEHSSSSLFVMPEAKPSTIGPMVREFISHEFFHVITPKYIQCDQIRYFDFQDPKPTKHLWFFEGTTEYMAHHVQLEAGIITMDQYFKGISDRLAYDDDNFKSKLSLTDFSMLSFVDSINAQFELVYNHGSAVSLCLDIMLNELSHGTYNLRNLERDLGKKYGANGSFTDRQFFDDIGELTYPQIREFLTAYVDSPNPLPFKAIMEKIGYKFQMSGLLDVLSPLGGIDQGVIKLNADHHFYINNEANLDPFGRDHIKLKKDDIILSWNGTELSPENIRDFISDYTASAKEGMDVEVKVLRKSTNGSAEMLVLKTPLVKVPKPSKYIFTPFPDPTPEMLELRKQWMHKG